VVQKEEERQHRVEKRKHERQKLVAKKRNLETFAKDAKQRTQDFERRVSLKALWCAAGFKRNILKNIFVRQDFLLFMWLPGTCEALWMIRLQAVPKRLHKPMSGLDWVALWLLQCLTIINIQLPRTCESVIRVYYCFHVSCSHKQKLKWKT